RTHVYTLSLHDALPILFCISYAIQAFFGDPFFYTLTLLRVSFEWGTRLEYLFAEASLLMLILLFSQWYPKFSKRVLTSVFAVTVDRKSTRLNSSHVKIS